MLRPDEQFGKYRVVRDLGAGGMAQVFLASLDGPDGFAKLCVVKRILPQFARDDSYTQMFINEAKVAAMMSHPNIVQGYEFAKENGNYYLAMEYVAGASLDRLIRAARRASVPLGPRVAVDVGIAVAQALAYAHNFHLGDGTELNLVHRDVAPDNILLSRDGMVKLADFGVVKSALNQNATSAGVVKGKWSYMSPEQVTSQPVDARSDVFSLGVILYELCSARRLFKGESLPATVNLVAQASVPPLRDYVPNMPPRLERIILKALAKSPNDRQQSAGELASELESYRASQSWTSGGRHLGTLVSTLFPKDGSTPGSTFMAGTDSTNPGVAVNSVGGTTLETDDATMALNIEEEKPELPPALLWGAGVVALLGTALFWYFLL